MFDEESPERTKSFVPLSCMRECFQVPPAQKNTITSAILGFQIRVRDLKARVGVPLLPVKCRIVTIPGTNIRLRSPVSMHKNSEKKLA